MSDVSDWRCKPATSWRKSSLLAYVRMRKLAKEIANIMIEEQGTAKFIQRLSDPYWFQAFGCVLAYDWHSSGVTTVVTGILKGALSPEEHGIAVCGGKGRTSRKTPSDLKSIAAYAKKLALVLVFL